jgi:hypothetical protein
MKDNASLLLNPAPAELFVLVAVERHRHASLYVAPSLGALHSHGMFSGGVGATEIKKKADAIHQYDDIIGKHTLELLKAKFFI